MLTLFVECAAVSLVAATLVTAVVFGHLRLRGPAKVDGPRWDLFAALVVVLTVMLFLALGPFRGGAW